MADSITGADTPFITFYSFKGGVGRSMALINVAGILAGRGFKVLALDMDLEAPGISYLMRHESGQEGDVPPGFVDLLNDACVRGEEADLFALAPADVVERYSYSYPIPEAIRRSEDGLLRIMPAGTIDPHYQDSLDRLGLGRLYRDGQGRPLVKAFKEIITASALFDFVFVDSRTGFSDESGICTRDLADYLVVVMGLNRQNEQGTAEFLRSLRSSNAAPQGLTVVLSPVPNGEDELVERREKEASQRLSEAFGEPVPLTLQIPYHPRLALTEEPHIFRRSRGHLYEAYVSIEREVLRMMGVTVQKLSGKVAEAAVKKNPQLVLAALKQLEKLDEGSHVIGRLATGELKEMISDEIGSELRRHLAAVIRADSWAVSVLAVELHRKNHPDASLFYDRALEADPTDANNLGNYANFLTDVRKDHDGAEALCKRALEADQTDANNLGNYANFLNNVRKDHDGAEALYIRALEADPTDPNHLGNYAKLLFIVRRAEEAESMVTRAWEATPTGPPLLCELHFYSYAHLWDKYTDALSKLRDLLLSGARSEGWPLEDNVQVAKDSGHPHPEFIEALAKVVSAETEISTLDAFEIWQQLCSAGVSELGDGKANAE